MDDVRRLEAKGLARAKIRSKRRREQVIRRRAIRGSLALFAVTWAIVFGQLVTGNDPALSRSAHHTGRPLASAHPARKPVEPTPSPDPAPVAVVPDESESAPVTVAPTPTPTPTPAPAPVTVAPPPPPAPIVTSAS